MALQSVYLIDSLELKVILDRLFTANVSFWPAGFIVHSLLFHREGNHLSQLFAPENNNNIRSLFDVDREPQLIVRQDFKWAQFRKQIEKVVGTERSHEGGGYTVFFYFLRSRIHDT